MQQPLSGFLAVSDVDNTLLTVENGVPLQNLEAIQRFCSLGGVFTLATGRNIPSGERYLSQVPVNAPLILLNGALIWDYENQKVLDAHYLEAEQAKTALNQLLADFPGLGVEIMSDNLETYIVRANDYTQKHLDDEHFTAILADVDKVPGEWFKVLMAGSPEDCLAAEKYCKKQMTGSDRLIFQRTQDCYFEILPAGIDKGSALQKLCAVLKVKPSYSLAFGDYDNDMQMLRRAGFGVAVANAPRRIRRAARLTSDSCTQGGVAKVLNALCDIKTGDGKL